MSSDYHFGKWLSKPPPGEEIVITGISGRFPESRNVHEFRDNLLNKIDMVTDDDRRWNVDNPEIPKRFGKIYDLEKFDAGFFGVHYRQADIMDPMIKKTLELTVETLMDAGVNPSELKGSKTGVFSSTGYAELEAESLMNITKPQSFGVTGFLRSMMPGRISYYLKLKGPSFVVDTACSSSLYALQEAVKSIRIGKCENAIVIGANLLLHPEITRQYSRLGVLSPDGICKSFDQAADGYVRSEAVTCAFLQKAKDAKRVYGKIIHIKVNTDGFKPDGITVPSAQMQHKLINEVLEESETDPSQIGYLETHGTGTKIGDPLEAEAIDQSVARKRKNLLLIGALKSSIGHTESQSGISALIKAIIAMETGLIAPNIHLKNVKKGMKGFEEGRMKMITEVTKLEDDIIAINSVGFGGTNCHLLVQRFDKTKRDGGVPKDDTPRLVCVSGTTNDSVLRILNELNQNHLDGEYVGLFHQIFKSDFAAHAYKGFTILSKTGPIQTSSKYNQGRKNLFVFFGNNFQDVLQHLLNFASFKETMKKINKYLLEQNSDIVDTIFNNKEKATSLVLFVVQIGLLELFRLIEVQLEVLCGNSQQKIVTRYHHGDVTLKQATFDFYETLTLSGGWWKKNVRFQNVVEVPADSLVLNVSDQPLRRNRTDLVLTNNFLEIVGRLYEQGHVPQTHKLYPEVQYPVSRNTPMISPLVQWNYQKNWHTYKYSKYQVTDVTQKLYNISYVTQDNQRYLMGFTLNGRNLIPATEFLSLVWQTFLLSRRLILTDEAVVFENCNFFENVEMSQSGTVQLLVSVQRGSGNFEVCEGNRVLANGRVFLPEDVTKYQTELLPLKEEQSQNLTQDEIYRELNLRGYTYRGLFKGLVECDAEGTTGYIKWDNNWTTFMDAMLQMKLLNVDASSLHATASIRRLTIDTVHHLELIHQAQSLCAVHFYKNCNLIKSAGIEICGITTKSEEKKSRHEAPVLEKYVFVPNVANLELAESVKINTQIIIENSLEKTLKAAEIVDNCTKLSEFVVPLIGKILKQTPEVSPDLTLSTTADFGQIPDVQIKNLAFTSTSNFLLIVATNLLQRPTVLKLVLDALSPKGFVLTREEIDFVPKNLQHIKILTEHVTPLEKLILFQKSEPLTSTVFIQITWKNLEWLPKLQQALKEDANVVVHSDNQEPEGTLGFINCIRLEPRGNKVRCFFMMDEVPEFDPKLPFYQKQLEKQFAINVYKGGQWGTYRHLDLDQIQQVESDQAFVGDLSRLMGVDNNATIATPSNSQVSDEWTTIVHSYTTAIYCLFWVIQLKPGSRVLIHSGIDSAGLAAINVCLHYGCEIYITVDAEEHRNYLKKQFEVNIINLRDFSFEEVIQKETKGLGVNVILNFNSRHQLEANIRCMASDGALLDCAKSGSLNLMLMPKGFSYHRIALDGVSPETKKLILDKILQGMKMGYVKHIPSRVEPDEVFEARGCDCSVQVKLNPKRLICFSEKSYIIIGGLGGMGLELAQWLVSRGATKLVLASRVGIQTGYQIRKIRSWGVTVTISTEKITTYEGCVRLIDEAAKLGPIDAIFNLAVILKNAMFDEQTRENFFDCLAPKAQAATCLDQVTREYCQGLRFFVMFSSVACGLGNAVQSNYGMANSVMERICERRTRDGLPGLSIQWGGVGNVGLVVQLQKEKEMVIRGTRQQEISSCLEALDKLLLQDNPVVSSVVIAEKNTRSYDSAANAVAYVLGIKNLKNVREDATFTELGMDSMSGTEVVKILGNDYDIYLTANEVRSLTFKKLMEIEEDK